MSDESQREDDARRRLPACQRCKAKKTKCDRLPPRCTGCAAAKTACVVIDPITSKRYSRESIQRLEAREKILEARLAALDGSCGADRNGTTPSGEEVIVVHATPIHDAGGQPAPGLAMSPRGFVGDGSGLGFLRSIVLDARWNAHKSQILQHLSERPPNPELALATNSQPSFEEASALVDNYFTRFHIQHTFLLRQDVLRIFDSVYRGPSLGPASPQDLFRLWMIFALSAVSRYRQGASSDHPFGYYLAALQHLGSVPLIGSIDAIPNLLLVCRFGMYYNIGTSLWDISQFCMRQCIEQGLHAKPRHMSVDLLMEQHHRRIFWECYILDRWSSGVLDRPFAIAEADITVDLPVDARDETIIEASRLSDVVPQPGDSPTDLSVFLFCIRLRRITTRIQSAFYSGRGLHHNKSNSSNNNGDENAKVSHHDSPGHVYVLFYGLLEELESWRQGAPLFVAPRSLYERPEWYDFLFEKDKLFLVRGALARAPRPGNLPPQDLVATCFDCATRIIELFELMLAKSRVSCTRSYFQVVFVAGLSIIYCVSEGLHSDAVRCARTIGVCDEILRTFRRELAESGRFAVVFSILKDHFLRDSSSSAPTTQHLLQDASIAHSLPPMAAVGSGIWQTPESALPSSLTFPREGLGSIGAASAENGGWQEQQPAANGSYMLPPEDVDAFNPTGRSSLQYNGMMETIGDEGISLALPTLTEEMMEQLEAGLGEFAWGAVGTGLGSWGDLF